MTDKELYDVHKHLKRCVRCGKTDAFTLIGRSYCGDCCEKNREYYRKYYLEKEKDKKAQKSKKLREERKSNHLCAKCGKPLPENYDKKHTSCEKCRAKIRLEAEKRRRKNGILSRQDSNLGMCTRCHKKTPLNGKKVCAECYEYLCKSVEHARKFLDYSKVKKMNW